jgi:hypothetical protein
VSETTPPNTPKETDCDAREWWLAPSNCSVRDVAYDKKPDGFNDEELTRVISFSAFEKLREENEALRAELAEWKLDCDISENAEIKLLLKYHAAKELLGECALALIYYRTAWDTGHKARELLKKLREALNGK